MEDKSSLVRAMQGAHTVFAMTNYWEKMNMDLEIQQGKNIADAAVVCLFLFSLSSQRCSLYNNGC
jgi:hypothetical protein